MRFVVTGAGGMLAHAVRGELAERGHETAALGRERLDVTDAAAVDAAIRDAQPDAVIHCAAYTKVDEAEDDEACALRVNATACAHVASACRAVGARMVYPSTDYVFDGTADVPYPPDAEPAPINAYGRTKLAGETAARIARDVLVVRTSWLYGAGGRNFVRAMLDRAGDGEPLRVVDDQCGSPTWTRSLAAALVELLERDAPAGVYHATNGGHTTWHGLAVAALELAGVDADVEAVSSDAFHRPAARPRYSVLDCSTTEAIVGPLPAWREALGEALRQGV